MSDTPKRHLANRPAGVPSHAEGELAYRKWAAMRHIATLTDDVENIECLERLAHHLAMFSEAVREWQMMTARYS